MAASMRESRGGIDIASLVRSISLLETVVDDCDATHVRLLRALRSTIVRTVPVSKPAAAVDPPGVDSVLQLYRLLKIPLADRLDFVLAAVRPAIEGRGGSVELVAIKSSDTVELRCIGSSSDSLKRAIRQQCPEIQHIHHVRSATELRA